ncbi:MAG: family 20 glycosylhydrolase, partial [Flavobacteriaceae bacterium]
ADIRLIRSELQNVSGSDEGYELSIDGRGITIKAQTKAGAFYGIQSLLALQNPSLESKSGISFPYVKIKDHPRFGYRGFQLDVGRNFQTKETIKKIIDALAFYKINTFLFYFTEDEGWRLEIEGLPELTEVGGQRQHASMNETALHPSYGSGPFAYKEGSHGSGFYTKEDFIEILKYANERHIKVIPEVNLPGHARAAIKSMEKRYEKYMELGDEQEANRYRLLDPDDKSVYSSAQSFKDNVACVCRESVYRFYEKVVDVIVDYYQEAEVPLEYFHVGGDEVPVGPWTASPICDDLLEGTEGLDAKNLHSYFFKRVVDILKKRDLIVAGWEETALLHQDGQIVVNKDFSGGQVVPYVWNNLWGAQDLGYKLANAGYPVVLCPVTNFYFDLAYDKHPEEPGLYWAGFVNTRNAYEYAPYNVFHTTTRDDSYYTPIDQEASFKNMERLTKEGAENILGIQAQLWSETLKGPAMLEYYLFPKLLGFAESAWAKERVWESIEDKKSRDIKIQEEWNQMANSIGKTEMKRLNSLFGGFNYRIPPPGAKIQNGFLFANSAYPGLEIRYTIDGSEPGPDSALYSEPIKINQTPVKLRAFNTEGRGSRTSEPKNTNLNLAP